MAAVPVICTFDPVMVKVLPPLPILTRGALTVPEAPVKPAVVKKPVPVRFAAPLIFKLVTDRLFVPKARVAAPISREAKRPGATFSVGVPVRICTVSPVIG
jgi:hypothetical protein